ncbi:MAG: hypothetical protein B0A82_22145 [Alkalinema sp. CACIAM 70d]|nr:MAG: hypothetical protein B0A82_22145 [Alkalinema sp. CACIAM 70d]
MLKSNRLLTKLLLSGTTLVTVLLLSASLGQSQFPGPIRDPIIKRPDVIKPIGLTPKIIMERVPLESPKGMRIYAMKRLQIQPNVIEQLRLQQNLIAKPRLNTLPNLPQPFLSPLVLSPTRLKTFVEPDQSFTRLSLDEETGHIFFLPRAEQLATQKITLLNRNEALKVALNHVNTLKLLPADSSQFEPRQLITLQKADVKQGQSPITQNVLQTVIFSRTLNQKPVIGEGSQLLVDLGNQGKLEGLERRLQQLVPTNLPTELRSDREVYDEIESMLKQKFQGASEIRVTQPSLVYSGNDRRYVQPAYTFTAEISSPNSVGKAFFSGLVAALKNPPEPVVVEDTQARELPGEPSGVKQLQSDKLAQLPGGPTGSVLQSPTVGRYVVRNDHSAWVDDANDFKNGMAWGKLMGFPTINYGDYYWDEPRLWLNQEDSFVDKWNVVLMEGHGANWLFTTRSNCCDIVDLNLATQPAYGDHGGSSMRYLFLKGCSIIPAPPDRANWPDPWWRVFKGLRQVAGFRTTMFINDDISYHFGYHIALNSRILDSWFHATNGSSSYQWQRTHGGEVTGYGAVVMIPGHEGDGIYFTNPAPPATSTGLTIWWQH